MAVLVASPASGQIAWRSGSGLAPVAPMSPKQLERAIRRAAAEETSHLIVHVHGAIGAEARAALRAAGVELLEPLGGDAYFASVRGTGARGAAREAATRLKAVAPIEREHKLHPRLLAGEIEPWAVVDAQHAGADGDRDPIVPVYVLLHRDVDLATAAALADELGGVLVSEMRTVNGAVLELPRSRVDALAARDEVKWVEPPLPRLGPNNDGTRAGLGVEPLLEAPYELDGAGVAVLVYDDGNSLASHVDFGGRLTVHDEAVPSNHATHVAGTIGGSGSASSGLYRGMAPGVTMHNYGLETSGSPGFLYTDPADLEIDYNNAVSLFDVALSNNSLGSNLTLNGYPCEWMGDYGVTASIIDGIVRGSLGRPMIVVWAAGNERFDPYCGDEYATIAPPAGAKNHITVGAINSDDLTVASFSSWGPTDDGRLKPDVCAPGCEQGADFGVTSTSGLDADGYNTQCGTSMSAPAVTGVIALMLQDHRQRHPGAPDPLSSTIKALLVQTAQDLTDAPGPDYRTGYGLVRAQDGVDALRSENWIEAELEGGQTLHYAVDVPPGTESLKVTLAWDDVPGTPNLGRALVNDLDLAVNGPAGGGPPQQAGPGTPGTNSVQRTGGGAPISAIPTGPVHYPWTLDPSNPDEPAQQSGPDRLNNVEQVAVSAPTPGVWRITVTGHDVPEGPQRFSLVADPQLVSTTISFPDGRPLVAAPGAITPVSVEIETRGESVVDGSPAIAHRVNDGAFTLSPLTPAGDDLYVALLPPASCDDVLEYFILAQGTVTGMHTLPAAAPTTLFSSLVGTLTDVFTDDFEDDAGWIVLNTGGLLDGAWERGVPSSDGSRGDPPTDADGSGQCYLTDNVNFPTNNSDVDNGLTYLISPALDGTIGDPVLGYWRWFSNSAGDNPYEDPFTVEISDDGGITWRLLETVGPAGVEANGGWRYAEHRLADVPDLVLNDQLRVRFTAQDLGLPSIVEAGVDGVTMTSFECDPDAATPGDVTGDGAVDVEDLLAVLATWGPCAERLPRDCPADLDGSRSVSVSDLLEVLGSWN